MSGALCHCLTNMYTFDPKLSGFAPGDIQVTVNPSDDFLSGKMAGLYSDPEVTNIKTSTYSFNDNQPKNARHGMVVNPLQVSETHNLSGPSTTSRAKGNVLTDHHETPRFSQTTHSAHLITDDTVTSLKEEANIQFQAGEYTKAIEVGLLVFCFVDPHILLAALYKSI